jgi:formylglycine-generating enzyme required for sulfatase activity
MRYVPDGTYWMGDNKNLEDEQPLHLVSVSPFYMDVFEVNIWHWDKVSTWAIDNDYEFSDASKSLRKEGPYWYTDNSALVFPMNMISWYDAVKWCNARSELEGRTPVYYLDTNHTSVYRNGDFDLNSSNVKWDATGYRLPTEIEWEYAARDGLYSKLYPWGNYLNGGLANYLSSGDPFDNSSTPVGYYNGFQKIVEATNSFNGEDYSVTDRRSNFGLYDLTGNVSEWCWDWYYNEWYGQSEASKKNNRGPEKSFLEPINLTRGIKMTRVVRGGSFRSKPDAEYGNEVRTAYRNFFVPESTQRRVGLRCVRGDSENDPLWHTAKKLSFFPNWYLLEWFGYYWKSRFTWVFHSQFGWIYPYGHGSYDNWIFFPKHGWMWTNRYVYPSFYSDKESSWYSYDLSNSEYGWFVNSNSGEKKRFGRVYPN